MSVHVHLEPVGGCAGDMFVAAMLDAFPSYRKHCWNDLTRAGLLEHVTAELVTEISHGLSAQRFKVALKNQPAKRTGEYVEVCRFIDNSHLDIGVKERAMAILKLLAEAEAIVHGVDIERVHFHEVADWDSLVDIVAAASLLERTPRCSMTCAPLPLGRGLVKTEHGMLPVPAPATTHLLRDFPVYDDGEEGERVTPTGAAILKYLNTQYDAFFVQSIPSGYLRASGSGAGLRKLQTRPNILRCLCIDPAEGSRSAFLVDSVVEMICDIDDMTAEEVAVSMDYIRRETGVLDVQQFISYGKKGRMSFRINVLLQPAYKDSVTACVFKETSTLGIRLNHLQRTILRREHHTWEDEHSMVRVKAAQRGDMTTAKAESDDLANVPELEVRRLRARQALDGLDLELL